MSDPATVLLVHGAWHGPWCWERVVPELERAGVPVRTVDLPSVGAAPESGADLSGDAATVRAALDEIEGPAVVCGHSYGGMAITQGAAGHPGVARLVYLCAFMPEPGESLVSLTGGRPAPWIQLLDDGMTLPDASRAREVFYGDCDGETAAAALARLRPMSGAAFGEPAAAAAWHDVPSTYVVCAQDGALPPSLQRERFAPQATETLVWESSHSPFLSRPAELGGLLAERARA